MTYRVVEHYYRQKIFDFFRPYPNPFYSLTFEVPADPVVSWSKERGYPVFLNLCYFLARAMQPVEDFRYRLLNGQIVLYDAIHIGMTVPADDGLFSFVHHEYHPDAELFNAEAAKRADAGRGASTLDGEPHTNYIYATAIPGVAFTNFVHATPADLTDGAPRVAFSKFSMREGRRVVSLGFTVNHLFIDGAALGRLAESAEAVFSSPG